MRTRQEDIDEGSRVATLTESGEVSQGLARQDAESLCLECNAPIGYGAPYFGAGCRTSHVECVLYMLALAWQA